MRVLIIDDEPDIRRIARLSLEAIGGMQTFSAASAPDGLRIAAAETPDAILMDMMMPAMDGLTALAQILQDPVLRHIPVVFLTARVQRGDIAHYLRQGAAGVIQKPFDPLTLPNELRAIVQRRRHPGAQSG